MDGLKYDALRLAELVKLIEAADIPGQPVRFLNRVGAGSQYYSRRF